MPEDPYYVRLRRLREERGLSRPTLFRMTKTVGLDTLVALERKPKPGDSDTRDRARYPSPETIADIAEALNVAPEEFPEFRLAMARRALDERAPGNTLDGALEALAVFERGQLAHATAMNPPEDVDIVAVLDSGVDLDHKHLVKVMRLLKSRTTPSVNLEAAVAEAITPSAEAAEARYRDVLRQEAQRTREHPEEPPETSDERDAQETRR